MLYFMHISPRHEKIRAKLFEICAICSNLHKNKKMTRLKIGDEWWTAPAEGENGALVMVTGRKGVDPVIESGRFNDRVEVTWKYGTAGMPGDETARLMEQVDNALREEFGRDAVAVLTGIYTGEGQRNWVFYVSSLQSFRYRFNHALEPFETLPLEIYAEHDPEWAEYREMRSLTEIADVE